MNLAYGDTCELIPTNFGKGRMKDLVDKRKKCKGTTSNIIFAPSNVNAHIVGVQQVSQVAKRPRNSARGGIETKDEPSLDEKGQQTLEKHIQEQTGWDCPIFILAATTLSWGSWDPEMQARILVVRESTQK